MLSASKSGSAVSSGYNLTKSLRFRSSASAYLNWTPATTGTGGSKTWTYSIWVKRGKLGVRQSLADGYLSSAGDVIEFTSSDTLEIYRYGASNAFDLITTQVFRDPSAWYHIVVAMDTTQATAANRLKLYVNGSQVTAFSTATYPPTQNQNTYISSNNLQDISRRGDNQFYTDAYLTEVNFIDGQALTPSSFGSFSSTTGVWQPARYTGTYGTNGFYLPFTDTTSTTTLGYDQSGNGNNWTTNNISLTAGSTYDSMTDVPTLTSATVANYAIVNPLDVASGITVAQGNLYISTSSGNFNQNSRASFAIPSSGKFYWETKNTGSVNNFNSGIAVFTTAALSASSTGLCVYNEGGNIFNNGTNNGGYATLALGDVLGVAVDVGANLIYFYKNGTLANSGGTTIGITAPFAPVFGMYSSGNAQNVNFGQQPFTYTPPSGFVALNPYNLPTPTILAGNKYMDALLRSGTGATATVNSYQFSPDFVWSKSRSSAQDHYLADVVRGATKALASDLTVVEQTTPNGLTSFITNGYTLGSSSGDPLAINTASTNYVDWVWKAGGTGVTNTNGSITSTVSVNASAGFSVVTWTAPSSGSGTVGHGLGVAPAFMIWKSRSNADNWVTYQQSLGLNGYLLLNTTDATTTSSGFWGTIGSSTFNAITGTNCTASRTYVSYCWAAIPGFSAFGSYVGNSSFNGPFIYTGFQPKFIMFKGSSFSNNWYVVDATRNPYNAAGSGLKPNASDSEIAIDNTANSLNFLSNGFQLTNNASSVAYNNSSGQTFIYAAFASNPFRNSLAF
jgi:hypothetical protein